MLDCGLGVGPWRSRCCHCIIVDVFPFPPCKAGLMGNFCVNRRCAPNRLVRFTLFDFIYLKWPECADKSPKDKKARMTVKPKRPESWNFLKSRNHRNDPCVNILGWRCPLRQKAIQPCLVRQYYWRRIVWCTNTVELTHSCTMHLAYWRRNRLIISLYQTETEIHCKRRQQN